MSLTRRCSLVRRDVKDIVARGPEYRNLVGEAVLSALKVISRCKKPTCYPCTHPEVFTLDLDGWDDKDEECNDDSIKDATRRYVSKYHGHIM